MKIEELKEQIETMKDGPHKKDTINQLKRLIRKQRLEKRTAQNGTRCV